MTASVRAEVDGLRAELALVREEHQELKKCLNDSQDVPLLAQGEEWAGLGHDSDDERDHDKKLHRQASHSFEARERRLSQGAEALERCAMLGDADVEVQQEAKEWAHALDDDDGDVGADHDLVEQHATALFNKRERRLSQGEEAMKLERPHGDQDVALVPESAEWAHHDADSSDDEGAAERFNEQQSSRRERRLTHGASVRDLQAAMGDAEVQVVAQGTEWAGAEEADDDNEPDARVLERRHSEAFERRERRLTLGAEELQAQRALGDVEVEVVPQKTEWAGDEDEEEEPPEKALEERCQARERRLTMGEEMLKQGAALGDADVEVLVQGKEWAGDQGEDDEEESLEKTQEERCQARERRLTMGEEMLKQATAIGDADVEVLAQGKEWAGAGGADNSDEDPQPQMERHESAAFERRERRLSQGAEVLERMPADGAAD